LEYFTLNMAKLSRNLLIGVYDAVGFWTVIFTRKFYEGSMNNMASSNRARALTLQV